MAIKGSLKEASLPDVIQLLFLGRRTGCLALADRHNFGTIYFEEGHIVYAAIVNRRTFAYKIAPVGDKPYWATNDGSGKRCFVSVSGQDRVAVISYRTGKEIASVPVGDHPQRMRMGRVRRGTLAQRARFPCGCSPGGRNPR